MTSLTSYCARESTAASVLSEMNGSLVPKDKYYKNLASEVSDYVLSNPQIKIISKSTVDVRTWENLVSLREAMLMAAMGAAPRWMTIEEKMMYHKSRESATSDTRGEAQGQENKSNEHQVSQDTASDKSTEDKASQDTSSGVSI